VPVCNTSDRLLIISPLPKCLAAPISRRSVRAGRRFAGAAGFRFYCKGFIRRVGTSCLSPNTQLPDNSKVNETDMRRYYVSSECTARRYRY